MQRREWERLVKAHVLPALADEPDPLHLLGGLIVVGDIGWTVRTINWMQYRSDERGVDLAAGVHELYLGPFRPELWHPLDGHDASGRGRTFAIPEPPADPTGVMAAITDLIRREGLPFLRRYPTPAAIRIGLAEHAAAETSTTRATILANLGAFLVATNDLDAARETLTEADTLFRPHVTGDPNPRRPSGRVRELLRLLDSDPTAARRALAETAHSEAKRLRLPPPDLGDL